MVLHLYWMVRWFRRKLREGTPPGSAPQVELPPARKAGRIVGEGVAAVPVLIRALQEEAQVL